MEKLRTRAWKNLAAMRQPKAAGAWLAAAITDVWVLASIVAFLFFIFTGRAWRTCRWAARMVAYQPLPRTDEPASSRDGGTLFLFDYDEVSAMREPVIGIDESEHITLWSAGMKALLGGSAALEGPHPIGAPLASLPFWSDDQARAFESFVARERGALSDDWPIHNEGDLEAGPPRCRSPSAAVLRLVGRGGADVVLEMRRLAASSGSTLLLLQGTPLDANIACLLRRPGESVGERAESASSHEADDCRARATLSETLSLTSCSVENWRRSGDSRFVTICEIEEAPIVTRGASHCSGRTYMSDTGSLTGSAGSGSAGSGSLEIGKFLHESTARHSAEKKARASALIAADEALANIPAAPSSSGRAIRPSA